MFNIRNISKSKKRKEGTGALYRQGIFRAPAPCASKSVPEGGTATGETVRAFADGTKKRRRQERLEGRRRPGSDLDTRRSRARVNARCKRRAKMTQPVYFVDISMKFPYNTERWGV
jgi:hypothetical protein